MIGLDTNALIRLVVADDPAQFAAIKKRLQSLDEVAESVLLNDVVLVEALWTLRRVYAFERTELQGLLTKLLATHTFKFENREVLKQAIHWYSTTPADFADCLIAAKYAELGCETTVTFDRGMRAMPMVEVLRT